MTIFDYMIISCGVIVFFTWLYVHWKLTARREFIFKLKHGEDWHHILYPERYTHGGGPR
jgi:hypothetical protein